MPKGVFRFVFFIGDSAIKVPRLGQFLSGLRCNRWEREMWQIWKPVFGWENLCPIIFSDPFGLFVVMPRATQPVSLSDVDSALGDYYPDITSEPKPANFGYIDARPYVLDYGLFDKDDVNRTREYYRSFAARRDL
jgi:hypothetical protein